MKRLLALLVGGLGIRALLRRRGQAELGPAPAEELRARLADAKALEDERDAFESGEVSVDQVDVVDARRADVHDRARRAIDELGES
jgi:hypothetical protein